MAEKLCELRKKGGGGGRYKETSLWTNPSPSSAFATQDVTLSQSMDDFKYLAFKVSNGSANFKAIVSVAEFKNMPLSGANAFAIFPGNANSAGNTYFARFVTYKNTTTVNITTGYQVGGTSQNNTYAIPLEILGLNELEYKPDDYIVTSGTFSIASLSTPVTVTIGFKPQKLTAWRVSASNNFESFTYDDSISTTSYTRMQVASGSNINGGTRNIRQSQTNDLISINNDGFTLASGVVTGTWNYFATGVAE